MGIFSWVRSLFSERETASSGFFTPADPVDVTNIGDNGLPSGWHFVGYIDDNGKTHYIGDEITDQQVRDCDRVFIAKTFPNGSTRYRQFSSASSKDAIGDMLIRESGEGSPI